MTGFESKRQMAQDKLTDDAQGYIEQYEAALLVSYQSGFADGKRSAERKPLTIKEINAMPEAQGRWPIGMNGRIVRLIRAVEAVHNIKENT